MDIWSIHRGNEKRKRSFVGKDERRYNFVVEGLRGRVMLSWVFKRWGVMLWGVYIWRAKSSALLFWNQRLNKQSEWELPRKWAQAVKFCHLQGR